MTYLYTLVFKNPITDRQGLRKRVECKINRGKAEGRRKAKRKTKIYLEKSIEIIK